MLKSLRGSEIDQFILNVVGDTGMDPSYFKSILRQIERYGLTDVVRFKGILSDSELAGCMKASHLLVMPSFYEGFGIVYLEGMGFGLPAIGTNCGGTKEIISHGVNGFLVSPGDYASLAEYLISTGERPGAVIGDESCGAGSLPFSTHLGEFHGKYSNLFADMI